MRRIGTTRALLFNANAAYFFPGIQCTVRHTPNPVHQRPCPPVPWSLIAPLGPVVSPFYPLTTSCSAPSLPSACPDQISALFGSAVFVRDSAEQGVSSEPCAGAAGRGQAQHPAASQNESQRNGGPVLPLPVWAPPWGPAPTPACVPPQSGSWRAHLTIVTTACIPWLTGGACTPVFMFAAHHWLSSHWSEHACLVWRLSWQTPDDGGACRGMTALLSALVEA